MFGGINFDEPVERIKSPKRWTRGLGSLATNCLGNLVGARSGNARASFSGSRGASEGAWRTTKVEVIVPPSGTTGRNSGFATISAKGAEWWTATVVPFAGVLAPEQFRAARARFLRLRLQSW